LRPVTRSDDGAFLRAVELATRILEFIRAYRTSAPTGLIRAERETSG
jgi:hypothetical protein